MLFAKNDVAVVPGYSAGATFIGFNQEDPILKLTIRVKDNPVILQIAESVPPNFTEDSTTEIQLALGVMSLIPATAWHGFRVKTAGASAARVNVIAYG